MNKLIDGLFEHKLLLQILSVLTAILLWFIVLDMKNPMTTRTLSVPVTSNQEVLEEQNLRIIGTGAPAAVEVTIRGRRNKVNLANASEFSVQLDYEQVKTSGQVTVKLGEPVYSGANHVRVVSMSPSQFPLKLERITGSTFEIEVQWEGELPEGYKAVNVQVEPNTLVLEDKESLINRVERVVVNIDATALDKTSNVTRRVLVLDANGKAISQFDGKNSVTVSYDLVRSLPVVTRVTGTPAPDWYLTGYKTSPEQVQVLGRHQALSELSSVQAAEIDLAGKEGSFTAELSLKVPEGFTLYGIKPLVKAEVQMEKLVVRDLVVPAAAITIENLDAATRALSFISTEFTFQIKGKADALASITPEALVCTLDASTLPDGESPAVVRVALPEGVSLLSEPNVQVSIVPADASQTPQESTEP